MRRVIVESPFAPQTPELRGNCLNVDQGLVVTCLVALGAQPPLCDVCENKSIRAEELARNARYFSACLRDCILSDESPYASHGLLTREGVLRDDVPEERAQGIAAGFAWREVADATVFYVDLGWSWGMRAGEEDAQKQQRFDIENEDVAHVLEYRNLGADWDNA